MQDPGWGPVSSPPGRLAREQGRGEGEEGVGGTQGSLEGTLGCLAVRTLRTWESQPL